MAPEVVKQVAYTKKADIWSVGCLIVEMLTGEHPWAQLNQMQAIFKVSRIAIILPFPWVADIVLCPDWFLQCEAAHPL
jgi:mitogen-activated protein kinase kinase kinase